MQCRRGCGACCIAPSISTPLPGMPHGKPAGVPCVNLDESLDCKLFNHASRPDFCSRLQAAPDMCGDNRDQALITLHRLETLTNPP
jgi:Fe-S-cluster containining protein